MKNVFIIVLGLTLSACSNLAEKSFFGGDRVTTASANQMLDPKFEELTVRDFVLLLDDKSKWNGKGGTHQKHIRKALEKANQGGAINRARIQDYFILASNQRCNLFKTYIKRVSVYNNSIFGTLTTVLGGAGAIVTGEESARILSGLAGITSGTRSELNQSIFESVATSIIIPGIEAVRKEHMDNMMLKRALPIERYTVAGAIGDAILYHGACSMDSGIAHAQKSIQSFDDIGLKRLQSANEKLAEIRATSQAFTLPFSPNITIAKNEIDKLKARFDEHKSKTPAAQAALITAVDAIINTIKPSGSVEVKAVALDKEMKDLLALYSSTTGHEKTVHSDALVVKQNQIEALVKSVEDKEKGYLEKLNKVL